MWHKRTYQSFAWVAVVLVPFAVLLSRHNSKVGIGKYLISISGYSVNSDAAFYLDAASGEFNRICGDNPSDFFKCSYVAGVYTRNNALIVSVPSNDGQKQSNKWRFARQGSATGSESTSLSPQYGEIGTVDAFPKGDKLVLSVFSDDRRSSSIWTYSGDDSSYSRLTADTSDGQLDVYPKWGSDGLSILYLRTQQSSAGLTTELRRHNLADRRDESILAEPVIEFSEIDSGQILVWTKRGLERVSGDTRQTVIPDKWRGKRHISPNTLVSLNPDRAAFALYDISTSLAQLFEVNLKSGVVSLVFSTKVGRIVGLCIWDGKR